MSADPVNRSDYEAQHAAIHAAAVAIAAYYSADDGPETEVAQVAYRAMYPIIAAAVRAGAVADEQQIRAQAIDDFSTHEWAVVARAERTIAVEKAQREAVQQVRHDMELLADRVNDYTPEGVRIRLRNYAAQLEHSLAAGSVPVASSEPTSCERCGHPVHAVGCLARPLVHGGTYTCGCGGTDDVRTVATPPAEPAATVHDANCEQQLGACCCHCQKRADVAFSHAAPSQPVTCEHGKTGWHLYVDRRSPISGTRQCPGPVSVPKESSE